MGRLDDRGRQPPPIPDPAPAGMVPLPDHHPGAAWHAGTLLDASEWLQLKAATTSDTGGIDLLVELGRTKRIRNTARTGIKQHGSR